MMDKYEEFKKWYKNNDDVIMVNKYGNPQIQPFKEFEEEYEKEEKEKEIKELLSHYIYGKSYFAITIGEQKKYQRYMRY